MLFMIQSRENITENMTKKTVFILYHPIKAIFETQKDHVSLKKCSQNGVFRIALRINGEVVGVALRKLIF